jgi:hypothetical protein
MQCWCPLSSWSRAQLSGETRWLLLLAEQVGWVATYFFTKSRPTERFRWLQTGSHYPSRRFARGLLPFPASTKLHRTRAGGWWTCSGLSSGSAQQNSHWLTYTHLSTSCLPCTQVTEIFGPKFGSSFKSSETWASWSSWATVDTYAGEERYESYDYRNNSSFV